MRESKKLKQIWSGLYEHKTSSTRALKGAEPLAPCFGGVLWTSDHFLSKVSPIRTDPSKPELSEMAFATSKQHLGFSDTIYFAPVTSCSIHWLSLNFVINRIFQQVGRGGGEIKIICFCHACCSQHIGSNYILPEGKEDGVSFPHNANCRLKSLSRLYSVPIIVSTPQALFFFFLINITCTFFRGTFLKLSYKLADKETLQEIPGTPGESFATYCSRVFPSDF